MKKFFEVFTGLILVMPSMLAGLLLFSTGSVSAATNYNPSYLISDNIFENSASMSAGSIQGFLASENSGLAHVSDVENCNPSTPTSPDPWAGSYYSNCGQTESAAQIIYDAGQAYDINPQSILATLEKEQSLVTTPNPTSSQINCAMGYDSCHADTGFFNQVDNGAWQFRTDIQLMNNISWWGKSPSSYPCKSASSLYSAGLYPGNTVTFANPGGTAVTVTIGDSSTAALYCYTPYVGPYSQTGYSGSYNFVVYFQLWFGSTAEPCYNDSNVSGALSGGAFMTYYYAGHARLAYTQLNNTGSTCVEDHIEASGNQSWLAHIATGIKATDPSQGMLVPSFANVDHAESLNYILYSDGTGNVEVHRLSPNFNEYPGYYDVRTNLTGVSPSTGTFVAGDFLDRGYNQLAYVLYNGSSGNMEIHVFNPGMTQGIGYYDLTSDFKNVTPTSGVFVEGDFFGRGYDQLAYVTYGNTQVHVLNLLNGQVTRMYEQNTNLTGTSSTTGTFIAGDFLGRGYDQLEYVLYSGANGNVETHMFNPGLNNAIGFQDLNTNIGGFTPGQ
jgi:hypothetical protein